MMPKKKTEQTSMFSACPQCGLSEIPYFNSINSDQNVCPKCGHIWVDDFIYHPPPAAEKPEKKKRFDLSKEQLDALKALLGLVHYDDLSFSWIDILPEDMRPENAKKEEDYPGLF